MLFKYEGLLIINKVKESVRRRGYTLLRKPVNRGNLGFEYHFAV